MPTNSNRYVILRYKICKTVNVRGRPKHSQQASITAEAYLYFWILHIQISIHPIPITTVHKRWRRMWPVENDGFRDNSEPHFNDSLTPQRKLEEILKHNVFKHFLNSYCSHHTQSEHQILHSNFPNVFRSGFQHLSCSSCCSY